MQNNVLAFFCDNKDLYAIWLLRFWMIHAAGFWHV